jgi:hypothetical protein
MTPGKYGAFQVYLAHAPKKAPILSPSTYMTKSKQCLTPPQFKKGDTWTECSREGRQPDQIKR